MYILFICFSNIMSAIFNTSGDWSSCNNSHMSDEGRRGKRIPIFLYSHARKQSILKEMLSRETDEPDPGPFSVLNCSQNLRWETSVLTGSLLIASEICEAKVWSSWYFELSPGLNVDNCSWPDLTLFSFFFLLLVMKSNIFWGQVCDHRTWRPVSHFSSGTFSSCASNCFQYLW